MASWQVTQLDWTGARGASVQVEAETRQDAESAAFAQGLPQGAVETLPLEGETADVKPCGCRASGLTRNITLHGVATSYQVARGTFQDRVGTVRCVGCHAVEPFDRH